MKKEGQKVSKTATIYDLLESEIMKTGMNEYVDENGKLIFFDSEYSIMSKILAYEDDIYQLITKKFFIGQGLEDVEKDKKFKKAFLHRFLHREINRQTIEAFATQVVYTFMANEDFINRIYSDLEQYLLGKTTSNQESSNTSTTDNRSAFSQLPQNNVHLDVDSTVMTTANDNTISRNKQATTQNQQNENSQYKLDELYKINGLIDMILDKFDIKCFLQTW